MLKFSIVSLSTGIVLAGFVAFSSTRSNEIIRCDQSESGLFEGELPFAVRLDETIVLDDWAVEPMLRVDGGGGSREIPAEKGREVALSRGVAVVKKVGPWAGLFPDARGNAMAALTLDFHDGGRGDVLGIRDGEWIRVGAETAINFRWTSSEEEARQRLADAPAPMESARWGAVDGRSVHWFSSFTQGEGSRLQSGESLLLLDIDLNWSDADRPGLGERPAVQVRSIAGGVIRDTWYPAEVAPGRAPVLFEYPASRKQLLMLCAWNEDEVLAAAYVDGKRKELARLESGAAWRPDSLEFTLRWRRALRGAVFVPSEGSPFVAATLDYGGKEIHVRQGEAVRVEDDILRFSPGKRLTEFLVSILHVDGSEEQVQLRPQAESNFVFESNGNLYSLPHENVRPGQWVDVEVLPRPNWTMIAMGAGLMALGAMGIAISIRRAQGSS